MKKKIIFKLVVETDREFSDAGLCDTVHVLGEKLMEYTKLPSTKNVEVEEVVMRKVL